MYMKYLNRLAVMIYWLFLFCDGSVCCLPRLTFAYTLATPSSPGLGVLRWPLSSGRVLTPWFSVTGNFHSFPAAAPARVGGREACAASGSLLHIPCQCAPCDLSQLSLFCVINIENSRPCVFSSFPATFEDPFGEF